MNKVLSQAIKKAVSDFKPVVQNKNKLKKNQNNIKPIKIEKTKEYLCSGSRYWKTFICIYLV